MPQLVGMGFDAATADDFVGHEAQISDEPVVAEHLVETSGGDGLDHMVDEQAQGLDVVIGTAGIEARQRDGGQAPEVPRRCLPPVLRVDDGVGNPERTVDEGGRVDGRSLGSRCAVAQPGTLVRPTVRGARPMAMAAAPAAGRSIIQAVISSAGRGLLR